MYENHKCICHKTLYRLQEESGVSKELDCTLQSHYPRHIEQVKAERNTTIAMSVHTAALHTLKYPH